MGRDWSNYWIFLRNSFSYVFSNFYSNNGGGFYGFCISTSKEINPKYADIIISIPSEIICDNIVLEFNDNNYQVTPSAPNLDDIELPSYEEVMKNNDYYNVEPSAPIYDKQLDQNND